MVEVTFQQLGSSLTVEEDVFSGLESFVCQLYEQECDSVNKVQHVPMLIIKVKSMSPTNKGELIIRPQYMDVV